MNIAYIRISSNKQDCETQKIQILEYCHKHKILLDEIIKFTMTRFYRGLKYENLL